MKQRHTVMVATSENIYVHAHGAHGTGHTLCGLSMDELDPKIGITSITEGNRRIDCPDCAQVVRHCRTLRASDFHDGLIPKKNKVKRELSRENQ